MGQKAENLSAPSNSRSQTRSKQRYRSIVEAVASGVLSKGAILLVSAISVPLTVRYLGAEQYGIWITISTTMTLLAVMDFGIANSLTNFISDAFAKDNRELAGRYAATAFWTMVLIAVVLGLTGLAIVPRVNWGSVFHLQDPNLVAITTRTVAAAYIVFVVSLPAGLATKLLGGYQEVRTANVFGTLGSILSLLGILAVVWLHGTLPTLVLVYAGALVLANACCLLWLWSWHKPWLAPAPSRWDRSVVKSMMQSGSQFFVLQLAGLVVFNSDNLVIAHYLNPAAVTPYSVTWRLVGYSAALQTLMVPALWPAYSEAYARGDMLWIRNTYWRVMKITMSVAGFFCLLFVFAGRTIIRYWAGEVAVPQQSLVVVMCIWVLISTLMNNEACILAAANEIRLQAFVGAIAAVVNLAVTISLVQRIGTLGVILGTVISYIVIVVGPQTWRVQRLLRYV
jgi:O-antigen/teichoic acid export membrane protein